MSEADREAVPREAVPREPLRRSVTMADVFEAVTRSPRALVVVRVPEGTILAANAAAAELLGEDATAVVGRRVYSLYSGADEIHSAVALSALAAGALDSYNARRRLAGRQGAEAWASVRRFDVEGGSIALGLVTPVDEPRPRDGVGEELAASDTSWASRVQPAGSVRDPLTGVLDGLSVRKRQIVSALLQGERVPAIAASMFVSTSTIRSHLSVIFRVFGVGSQTELISLLRSPDRASTSRP
jgi:PAS domain S-box-containing protein